jgi:hypothetical protein
VVRELEKVKPDKWGFVKTPDLWSPQEEKQEEKFKLGTHKYEEYKGVCFGNGDCVLVVDVWLHRVDEDDSGLTFEEWDPSSDTDASEAPVAMIVNSSEL